MCAPSPPALPLHCRPCWPGWAHPGTVLLRCPFRPQLWAWTAPKRMAWGLSAAMQGPTVGWPTIILSLQIVHNTIPTTPLDILTCERNRQKGAFCSIPHARHHCSHLQQGSCLWVHSAAHPCRQPCCLPGSRWSGSPPGRSRGWQCPPGQRSSPSPTLGGSLESAKHPEVRPRA